MADSIGRYRIVEKLGEGGMGVVYSASDDRLDRLVAIKTIREAAADPRARERLWREARAAARVNHPNVCQVYEVGEAEGALYIAMELLDGEPLAAQIGRGPLPLREAVEVAAGVLAALGALHGSGIIHRDLKPSNVFLTRHGVKILDFGLARPPGRDAAAGDATAAAEDLTVPGTVVGTPRYMAPEQWAGQTPGPPCDLFALGAILFEMLTARPAFGGENVIEVCRAITHDHPPALSGGAAVLAVDRAIHRALEKRPEDRYPTADAMARDLRAAIGLAVSGEQERVLAMKRIIVLPFRALRADPETEFLSFGLADAITASLSSLESLVVRSSLAGARFGGDSPDLRRIASEADVDVALFGTLLRAGDQLRVSTQLVEVPVGTLVWTKTAQVLLRDIFELQDDLARQIVASLSAPLAGQHVGRAEPTDAVFRELTAPGAREAPAPKRAMSLQPLSWILSRFRKELSSRPEKERGEEKDLEDLVLPAPETVARGREGLDRAASWAARAGAAKPPPLQRDVPASAKAYELYLRANQVSYDTARLAVARDLYRASLAEDPGYAPAWARLGRVARVMAKYGHGDVEENFRLACEAFRKALELNPDLSVAHNLYTYLELEELGRSRESMVRLLTRARSHAADPALFAGLVVSLRFCGLLEASLAADRRARALDPQARTSVAYTYWMLGDYERALLHDDEDMRYVESYSLAMMGQAVEAAARLREISGRLTATLEREIHAANVAALERNRDECVRACQVLATSRFHDPEGLYFAARGLARVGEADGAIATLERVVSGGFFCDAALGRDPWFDAVRPRAEFARILRQAEEGRSAAADAYTAAGGESLLGTPPA